MDQEAYDEAISIGFSHEQAQYYACLATATSPDVAVNSPETCEERMNNDDDHPEPQIQPPIDQHIPTQPPPRFQDRCPQELQHANIFDTDIANHLLPNQPASLDVDDEFLWNALTAQRHVDNDENGYGSANPHAFAFRSKQNQGEVNERSQMIFTQELVPQDQNDGNRQRSEDEAEFLDSGYLYPVKRVPEDDQEVGSVMELRSDDLYTSHQPHPSHLPQQQTNVTTMESYPQQIVPQRVTIDPFNYPNANPYQLPSIPAWQLNSAFCIDPRLQSPMTTAPQNPEQFYMTAPLTPLQELSLNPRPDQAERSNKAKAFWDAVRAKKPRTTPESNQPTKSLPNTYAGRRSNAARKDYPWECGSCHKRFLFQNSATKHHRQSHSGPVNIIERWPNAPKRPPPGEPRNSAAARARKGSDFQGENDDEDNIVTEGKKEPRAQGQDLGLQENAYNTWNWCQEGAQGYSDISQLENDNRLANRSPTATLRAGSSPSASPTFRSPGMFIPLSNLRPVPMPVPRPQQRATLSNQRPLPSFPQNPSPSTFNSPSNMMAAACNTPSPNTAQEAIRGIRSHAYPDPESSLYFSTPQPVHSPANIGISPRPAIESNLVAGTDITTSPPLYSPPPNTSPLRSSDGSLVWDRRLSLWFRQVRVRIPIRARSLNENESDEDEILGWQSQWVWEFWDQNHRIWIRERQ